MSAASRRPDVSRLSGMLGESDIICFDASFFGTILSVNAGAVSGSDVSSISDAFSLKSILLAGICWTSDFSTPYDSIDGRTGLFSSSVSFA